MNMITLFAKGGGIMDDNLRQISSRIRELRDILGIETASIANSIGVPEETYLDYESGKLDIPISVLYKIASELGIDTTVLLTGEAPRMNTHCIVRADHGVDVERYPGYRFSSIAYNFIGREMEPLLVSIEPDDDPPALVMHGGQEFNYVLEGKIRITLGRNTYELSAGDCIYFDPRLPHAQAAVGKAARFITVINEK
jgi:quercetin dioxygenase-like cupin family protein/DNA-binding XRE family transcriptional regulator